MTTAQQRIARRRERSARQRAERILSFVAWCIREEKVSSGTLDGVAALVESAMRAAAAAERKRWKRP